MNKLQTCLFCVLFLIHTGPIKSRSAHTVAVRSEDPGSQSGNILPDVKRAIAVHGAGLCKALCLQSSCCHRDLKCCSHGCPLPSWRCAKPIVLFSVVLTLNPVTIFASRGLLSLFCGSLVTNVIFFLLHFIYSWARQPTSDGNINIPSPVSQCFVWHVTTTTLRCQYSQVAAQALGCVLWRRRCIEKKPLIG